MKNLVKKVMAKLDLQLEFDSLVEVMESPRVYKYPKKIITQLQDFYNKQKLSSSEALTLLGKLQQKGIIEKSLKSNPNSERAWRLILKEWNLSNFRLERGSF